MPSGTQATTTSAIRTATGIRPFVGCPIRFQCAGCTFYRPGPSYLPALEAHVAELRVNKEHALATDAAGWVVTNLQDQVDAFSTVAKAMQTLLEDLPDDDRQRSKQPRSKSANSNGCRSRCLGEPHDHRRSRSPHPQAC